METRRRRIDAARWRALFVAGGRVRVLGSAGLNEFDKGDGYHHIGVELWSQQPSPDDAYARTELAKDADAIVRDAIPRPEGDLRTWPTAADGRKRAEREGARAADDSTSTGATA